MESIAGSIGHDALRTLHSVSAVNAVFETSSGFFLTTKHRNILFLTNGTYCGPFTINLSGVIPAITCTEPDKSIHLHHTGIFFENPDWFIKLPASTHVWYPGLTLEDNCASDDIVKRNSRFSTLLIERQISSDTKHELKNLITQEIKDYKQRTAAVKSTIRSQTESELQSALNALVGYGRGLTPAGDDFLCGLFLANYYFGKILKSNLNLEKVFQNTLMLAQQATTSLSLNLLRCAVQGSADERIMNCMDWLANGKGEAEKIIEELLTYGSSSGLETLEGLSAYINLSQ